MATLIESVANLLVSTPYKLQMAVNRRWENAWRIPISQFEYSEARVNEFLGKRPEIVAVELFYKTKDGHDFYFGIQHSPQLKNARDPHEFLLLYLSVIQEFGNTSFPAVVRALGKSLHAQTGTFFSGQPNSTVLGVVDWWMTFGPCEIWKPGDSAITGEHVRQQLAKHPKLLSNEKNYTGLEFEFASPTAHWLSFQVSEKITGGYTLDVKKVVSLFNTLLF